ncbi:MAG: hypothetical protein PHT59_07375 [Candidatus Omnitrophica bacterium]|nr:hypothetical protein [Candidatus Omnitrophota bacterium]
MKDPKRLEQFQLYHAVFGTTEGQAVLADIKKMCGYEETTLAQSIVDGKIDPYYTIHREGRRTVFIDILKRLTDPPDLPEDTDDRTH